MHGQQSFVSRPPLLDGGPIQADPIFAASEAPEADESQDGDHAKDLLEETSLTTSPPPAHLEEPSHDKKRKASKSLFLRVPLLPRMRPGRPLLPILKLKFLTSWIRESLLT
jgi:hypothetical protein